ncbi:cytochrome P450 [Streptomyces sp. NPDC085946]|uniref:cytochrome P450 n=1 Tax=Streptomyces sp. NPDC085946 TaxID=3365744 RepID=UPI0037D33131
MSNRPADITRTCTDKAGPHSMRLWLLARTGDPVAKLLEPGFQGDAYALYERMRSRGPVHRSRTGMLAILSYDHCSQVLQDASFSICEPAARPARMPTSTPQVAEDSPGGSRVKEFDQAYAAAAPLLRPALHRSATRIDTTAHDLLRRHADADSLDLINDFAFPLAVACLSEVLDIPAAYSSRFAEICDLIGKPIHGTPSRSTAEAAHDAHEDLAALVIRLEHERRHSPGSDLISRLTAPRDADKTDVDLRSLLEYVHRHGDRQDQQETGGAGRPGIPSGKLNLEEIAQVCSTLVVSGLDTAACLIGNAVAALAAHPDQWQTLRSAPQLAGKAVEETLRFDPPHQFTLCAPTARVQIAGHAVPPGNGILVMLAAAQRDSNRFPDPARFDLTRSSQPSPLTADGSMKLAVSLARLTGEAALWTLASRLPQLHPAGQAVRRPGGAVSGFTHLPFHTSTTAPQS